MGESSLIDAGIIDISSTPTITHSYNKTQIMIPITTSHDDVVVVADSATTSTGKYLHEQANLGHCYLGWGCMFAGKTMWLIRMLNRAADILNLSPLTSSNKHCFFINHYLDNREVETTSGDVTTHSSVINITPRIITQKCSLLADVDDVVSRYPVIGIDEGQFFSDLYEYVYKWVMIDGKTVYVASLDNDFNLNPFGQAHMLLGICEPGNVEKLYADCLNCLQNGNSGVRATCSYLKKHIVSFESSEESDDENCNIVVGGSDKYMPLCLRCYHKFNFV